MSDNVPEHRRSKRVRRETSRFSAEQDTTSNVPLENEHSVKKKPPKSKTKKRKRQKSPKPKKKKNVQDRSWSDRKVNPIRPFSQKSSSVIRTEVQIDKEMERISKMANKQKSERKEKIEKELEKNIKKDSAEKDSVEKDAVKKELPDDGLDAFFKPPNIEYRPFDYTEEHSAKHIKVVVPKTPNPISMVFFQPIETNIDGVEEQQLSNTPLVCDDTDDMAICSQMYKYYPNGIHGYEPNKHEVSTEILFELMSALLPATKDPELFYYALYRTFPNTGTQEEFSEMFPKLAYKFATNEGDYQRLLKLEHWKTAKRDEQKEEAKRSLCNHSNVNAKQSKRSFAEQDRQFRRAKEITERLKKRREAEKQGLLVKNLPEEDGKVVTVTTFSPCCHTGPCGLDNEFCKCDNFCSVACHCDVECQRRFPGCNCKPDSCKTANCPCVKANWECNPLTCKNCVGCGDQQSSCHNQSITNGLAKMVYQAESTISGNGAFIGEDVRIHEFLGEYTGERISKAESERRGQLYFMKTNYLFAISDGKMDIDATRAGNVFRFVNNSRTPNCVIKYLVVKGEPRIGFFAKRDIAANEELTFNYGYNVEHAEKMFKLAPSERIPKLPARLTAAQKEFYGRTPKLELEKKTSNNSNDENDDHLAGPSA